MSPMETEQIMSCGTLCTEHIKRGAIFVLSVIAYFSMVLCTGQRCEALSEKILIKLVDQTQDRPSSAGTL